MKRFLSGAFVVLMIVGLSSCKKTWICECTVFGSTQQTTIEDQTKGDAESACLANETTAKLVDPNASCELYKKVQ